VPKPVTVTLKVVLSPRVNTIVSLALYQLADETPLDAIVLVIVVAKSASLFNASDNSFNVFKASGAEFIKASIYVST